jgi:plastocyanin
MHQHSMRLAIGSFVVCALVLTMGCGSSSTPAAPTPTTGGGGGTVADVTISISGMNGSQSFSPNPATVKVGQTVAWQNADTITHTATADGGTFNTNGIAGGATSSPIMMSTAGTFTYHCSIHPTMVGTLTVTQ